MEKFDDINKIGISVKTWLTQVADYYFTQNLNRVKCLVEIGHDLYNQTGKYNRNNSKEILRAATVLLHASLEDLLRIICVYFIDDTSKEIIDNIPVSNNSNNGSPKKITLGSLIPHKNKKIHDLIRESIKQYYNQFVSFNNTNQISKHLKGLGIDNSLIKEHYKEISNLIERRHSIVHHMDLIKTESREFIPKRVPEPISQKEVKTWIKTVDKFALKLFDILSEDEYARKTNPFIKNI